MTNNDIINAPNHYCEGREYQPIDVISDWGLNFNLGNTVKYISRAGRKDDIVQDLKKGKILFGLRNQKIRRIAEWYGLMLMNISPPNIY